MIRVPAAGSLLARLRSSEEATGMLLAAVVGGVAGLGAVGFRWTIKGFQWLFFKEGAQALGFLGDHYVIVLPVIGGLIIGPLIYYLARETRAGGPAEVMKSLALGGGRIRYRVAPLKVLLTSVYIGSGGSVGREGPIVHIGSALGSAIGQRLRLPERWVRTLVLCGAAGATSATFNAPIGGVFFALEVLSRRTVAPSLFYVMISALAADYVAQPFLGNSPSFIVPEYAMVSYWEILPYALLGIASGLLAVGFVRFLYVCETAFGAARVPAWVKPALGGVFVGVIGFFFADIFGVGYGPAYGPGGQFSETGGADSALAGQMGLALLASLLLLKIVATSISVGSGASGGVFAPSLFMGAMLGGTMGEIMHGAFPSLTATSGAYALVGMGAFLAAVVRGPITAIVILLEMTRDLQLVLPLMTAVVISTVVAGALSRDSVYTARLRRQGIDIYREEEADVMRGILVGEAMTRDFPSVPPDMPVPRLLHHMQHTGHHGFPVVDGGGRFLGVVTLTDVEASMSREKSTDALTVADIATTSATVAYPDQSIHEALAQFGGREVGRIPVVDPNDPTKLLGVLRRHDIVRAYIRRTSRSRTGSGYGGGE